MFLGLWEPLLPLAVLLVIPWIAYWDVLSGTWVSDDCAFSGPEAKPISTYDGVQQKPISWHTLFKRLRYFFGRAPNPDKDWKKKNLPPYLPNARAHHRLNLWVFTGVLILLYSFLGRLFDPKLAFLATLLFAVHPLGGQTIGWISGIGYPLGTLFMLAGLNFVLLVHDFAWMTTPMGVLLSLLGYTFFQWMAVEAWFAIVGAVAVLLWLHAYPFAIIAGLFAIQQCFHTFREALILRTSIFKEQQMGQSTSFYPRKVIVVLKTLYYNTKLALFPKRMGLYHPFCYHYELPYVEQEDRYAMFGLVTFGLLVVGILKGSPAISLGCLWFGAFGILFYNWITANQFVVDRYVWLPSVGFCLIAASLLPFWAYWVVVGISLMRLWAHHYTYQNEFYFYQSNLLNFPSSEVAWGNLGVQHQALGEIGTALESWVRGIELNPDYDVCWYNLNSLFKMRGPLNPNFAPRFFNLLPREVLEMALQREPMRGHLHIARYCLQRAVDAKTCHFPKMWKDELMQLNQELLRPLGQSLQAARLIQPLFTAALT